MHRQTLQNSSKLWRCVWVAAADSNNFNDMIYFHVPFCKKACHYCNFHFSTSLQLENEIMEALLKELILRKNYIPNEVHSIYFGGGTPSFVQERYLSRLLTEAQSLFSLSPSAEITMEVNPDDCSLENLQAWKAMGINRLSMGTQSFFEEDLKWMNRAHGASDALAAIQRAQQVGFNNISIDLIYGGPTLSDQHWIENLNKVTELGITHLSAYALTVEPKTALEKLILKGKKEEVDQSRQAVHFELLQQWSKENGWEHYEISNLAKPGFRSQHNSAYWRNKPYLGIGPAAHSFDGESRQWNVSNNALYVKAIENNEIPCEVEVLSFENKVNEYLMTALRTTEGVALAHLHQLSKNRFLEIEKAAAPHFQKNHLLSNATHWFLSENARFLADGIAADLFLSPQ